MLDVLRAHEIAGASRALTLVDAIAAGVPPAINGEDGLRPYHAFVDRQQDIIRKPTAEDETAAEQRIWREFEASVGG